MISSDIPFRLARATPGCASIASRRRRIRCFASRNTRCRCPTASCRSHGAHQLDIVHAHYAVPHARPRISRVRSSTAGGGRRVRRASITTLHGTDITLVGSDPSYSRVVAFSIDQSDGVTAVSESLKATRIVGARCRRFEVIPNFLDCAAYRPQPDPELRARLCPPDEYDALLLHISNFRPVKRLDAVLDVFRRVRAAGAARSWCSLGDGPERARSRSRSPRWDSRDHVEILGEQDDVRDAAVERRCVPAAVGAGELRPGRRSKRWPAACRSSPRASAACRK